MVAGITLVAEVLQMMIILAVARPFNEAVELVENIALPMMITNTIGAAMFMRILLDRRAIFEKYTTAFSAKALQIAARAEGLLRHGFDQQNSMRVARILYEELGVGAVAITDRENYWPLSVAVPTTIRWAVLLPPAIPTARLNSIRWCMPTAMPCLIPAQFHPPVSWVQHWLSLCEVKSTG